MNSPKCLQDFEAEAFEKTPKEKSDPSVVIKISWKNDNRKLHEKIIKRLSVRGVERKLQTLEVVANGVTNTITENTHFNIKNKNPSKYSIFFIVRHLEYLEIQGSIFLGYF